MFQNDAVTFSKHTWHTGIFNTISMPISGITDQWKILMDEMNDDKKQ